MKNMFYLISYGNGLYDIMNLYWENNNHILSLIVKLFAALFSNTNFKVK